MTPRRPGYPPGLRPLGWRCERGGGFLNGASEDGVRLELWLSLARRASNSRMRSRSCSMSAICTATHFTQEWFRVGYSSISLGCMCSLPIGKRS